jgi:hypothetical protein
MPRFFLWDASCQSQGASAGNAPGCVLALTWVLRPFLVAHAGPDLVPGQMSRFIMTQVALVLIMAWKASGYSGLDFFLLRRSARHGEALRTNPQSRWRRPAFERIHFESI